MNYLFRVTKTIVDIDHVRTIEEKIFNEVDTKSAIKDWYDILESDGLELVSKTDGEISYLDKHKNVDILWKVIWMPTPIINVG